jgi:hypothetical protein
MPIPISYPLINGHRYSWTSVEAGIGPSGTIVRGLVSADYGDELTPGKLRGTGPNVIGRTRGEYDGDAEFEMYRLEWENLKAQLGSPTKGFGETAFPVTFQYAEDGQPVVTDTLEGCRITKVRTGGQEGSDPTKVKLTIDLTRILHNNIPIYTKTSGG